MVQFVIAATLSLLIASSKDWEATRSLVNALRELSKEKWETNTCIIKKRKQEQERERNE